MQTDWTGGPSSRLESRPAQQPGAVTWRSSRTATGGTRSRPGARVGIVIALAFMASLVPLAAATDTGAVGADVAEVSEDQQHRLTGVPHFVSPHGSDATGDGSRSRPWRTWRRGVAELSDLGAGHTLVLREGLHWVDARGAPTPSGDPGRPVRITSQPGERAVVTGEIRFDDPAHLVVDHLVFQSAPGADPRQPLLRVTNGSHWSIRDNEFAELRTMAALHVTGWGAVPRPAAAVVRGNRFHDQRDARPAVGKNTQHFVYAGVGPGGDLVVSGNEFYRGRNTGGAVKLGPQSLGRVELSHNTFLDNQPYSVLLQGELAEVDIRGNLFADSGTAHVQLWRVESDLRGSVRENLWWGRPLLASDASGWGASVHDAIGPGNLRMDPRLSVAADGSLRVGSGPAAAYGAAASLP